MEIKELEIKNYKKKNKNYIVIYKFFCFKKRLSFIKVYDVLLKVFFVI